MSIILSTILFLILYVLTETPAGDWIANLITHL